MSAIEDRMKERQANFKKGIDSGDSRRKREEDALQIRKSRKEGMLLKRRAIISEPDKENSAQNADETFQEFEPDNFHSACKVVMNSHDPEEILPKTRLIRQWLCKEEEPPIQDVIEQGLVPRMVDFMRAGNPDELRFEAAWVLTNIASGNHEHTSVVVASGALAEFITLVQTGNAEIEDQAIWALGNIAGDSVMFRNRVNAEGALDVLIKMVQKRIQDPTPNLTSLRTMTWCISNLFRGKPCPDIELIHKVLPILADLSRSTDQEIAIDACWGLSYCSDGGSEQIQMTVESGVIGWLMEILKSDNEAIRTPALRTLGNVLTGEEMQTQVVLECGFLSVLPHLLAATNKNIRKDALWAMSNITAGTHTQIQQVLDNSLLPVAIQHCDQGNDYDLRKEAVWILINAILGGCDEQVDFVVDQQAFPAIISMLQNQDDQLVETLLQGIDRILRRGVSIQNNSGGELNHYGELFEEAGGLDVLERMQDTAQESVYVHVCKIIKTYFQVEDDDDSDGGFGGPAPTVPEGGFNFA